MRPTGRLHIGHYFGALKNWIDLQSKFECFFFVADWHALTSDYADTSAIAQNTIEIATDWLAAGLSPDKATLFLQSRVPEHAELHLLLSMVTPLGWLERVPTYKEQLDNIKDKDLHTYGFLGYPVLQSADIVIYDADFVPVGEDQVPHVELTREIVRRFDFFYGFGIKNELFRLPNRSAFQEMLRSTGMAMIPGFPDKDQPLDTVALQSAMIRKHVGEVGIENFKRSLPSEARPFFEFRDVLVEPGVLLTETPRIPGTDGRKMSKSYGNAIMLSESDADIRAKSKVMMTDPARQRRTDKGNPDVCPVFSWHKLFSTKETLAWSDHGCRTAEIGCIECKSAMADGLIKWIAPIRERRAHYEQKPNEVREILEVGSKKARAVAQQTMARVREAVFGPGSIQAGPERRGGGAIEK